MKNLLRIMSLPIFLAMLMSAASLDVQAQVEINDQSPEGTKGVYKGRECVVVKLNGKKYAIATKNLGAENETDFGTFYTFDQAKNNSITGLSSSVTSWHVPTKAELKSFSGKINKWTTFNGIKGRVWSIGLFTSIFLPAISDYNGGRGYRGYYWSCTEYSDPLAYFMTFNSADCSIKKTSYDFRYGIRPFCEITSAPAVQRRIDTRVETTHEQEQSSNKIIGSNNESPNRIIIPAGTRVHCRLENNVRASKVDVGDKVQFKVSHDVMVNGKVVIKYGTPVTGTVYEAKRSKWWGTRGRLGIKLDYVYLPNANDAPLENGNLYVKGKNRTTASVLLFFFVTWPACFICGERAEAQAGTEVVGYIATDTEIYM